MPHAVPPLPARFADTRQPAFVGRSRELERLERVWELVERGQRQAVFIGGEPGAGKSRIAEELARGLHARGVAVLLGCTSPDLSYPYEPLIDAMDQLLGAADPEQLAHLATESVAGLVRLVPALRPHVVEPAEAPTTDRENRRELFAAYSEVIRRAALVQPVALFLEDVHWASTETRLMINYLVDSTPDVPLLVLATMRTTPPDRSEDLSDAIADLHRLPGVTRMDLDGLDLDDIEMYLKLEGANGTVHVREAAAILSDQTGGNPFFLAQLWQQINWQGGLEALVAKRVVIPPSVRDTLTRRLRSAPEEAVTVLEHAAVLGDSFAADDLIAVLTDSEFTLTALDYAVAAGFVSYRTDTGAYTFEHALVRQALLDRLTPSRSARIHASLANALQSHYRDDPSGASLLARLFDGARALGYHGETIEYLCGAAEFAGRSLAHEKAAALWERAARLTQHEPQAMEILLSAARSRILAGEFAAARDLYREVNRSDDPTVALRAAIGFEDASWRPGVSGDEACSMIEAALGRTAADPTDPLYIRALTAHGRSLAFSGDFDAAERVTARALALARGLGADEVTADAIIGSILCVMAQPGVNEDHDGIGRELREIALRTGDYDRLGPSGAYRGLTAYRSADIRGWKEGWNDIKLAARKTGQPLWTWLDGCYEHCRQFMIGSFQEAMATAERIKDLGHTFGADDTDGPYGIQMYNVQRQIGGIEPLRGMVSGDPAVDGTWEPGLLALYTELGLSGPVKTLLSRLLRAPELTAPTATYPALVVYLVEAALFLGDDEAIRALVPAMQTYDGQNIVVGQFVTVFGSGSRYLGRMHHALGDIQAADAHFHKALTIDVDMGSVVHESETLAHYAVLHDQAGDGFRSSQCRARAREIAAPIGQTRVLRMIDGVMSNDRPHGLSSREVEVLRLMAAGASNREIGGRLFISQNTVANHVRNILVKTGCSNRTAAVRLAVESALL